jgi:hypothetical protein
MAKYSDIKGFTVQTVTSDPAASVAATGSWSSGGSLNLARYDVTGAGSQTAALATGGYEPVGNTELYNGSTWTEVNDLNTARYGQSSTGSQTSALAVGGNPNSGITEKWDGTNWTESGDLNTGRHNSASAGSDNEAVITFGGQSPQRNNAEVFNGTSWTEVSELNLARHVMYGTGSSTAALGSGGNLPPSPYTANTEIWNGSSWTEVAEMNTIKGRGGMSGSNTDALVFSGTNGPGLVAVTENYNGTSWTELADLSTQRYGGSSTPGTSGSTTATLYAGGATPSDSSATEEWTTTPSALFQKTVEGQLFFNSTTNTFKETISDIPGTSWSSGTNLNQARSFNNAAGSIPSAITFGGSPAPTQAYAEQWNGSAWTEVADLNEGRVAGAGGGASGTDAIMAGGYELPNVGNSLNTEIWDGSSWTEVNNLNAQKYTAGSAIPVSTSGFAFGGNPSVATAEVWDGTNWTEVSDLNTARMYLAGFGSATSAIAGNGIDPSASPPTYLQNKVEKWDGSSWTEVAEYNTARVEMLQGQGSSNAAGIVAGGSTTGSNQIANTEIWNGTSWTEANDLATARRMGGQIGSTTSGMYVGGSSPSDSTTVEHWESGLANKTITAS